MIFQVKRLLMSGKDVNRSRICRAKSVEYEWENFEDKQYYAKLSFQLH